MTNITPTSEELRMEEQDFIVSKTDPKGKITYCNESFIRFSGYEESDLLQQPHNIIRHPDMPRSIYRFLWETICTHTEFFGIVKNLCKNGAYYWTFANVTSSTDEEGNIIGYYSVRRQANQKVIDLLTPVYKQMVEEEAKHSSSKQAMDASFKILTDYIATHNLSYKEFVYTYAK